MNNESITKIFVVICIVLLFSRCEKNEIVAPTKNVENNSKTFEVMIRDNNGIPVEGVSIEGGIDWDAYYVKTNEKGIAILPKTAFGRFSKIYKTNYMPVSISGLSDSVYTINHAIKKLELIGQVEGKAIRFKQNELITLDYFGKYHVYNYNDKSVNEIFSIQLDHNAIAIRDIKLLGDTLWFSTHESGIFCYSIKSPTSPKFLFRVSIQGYLGAFAVKNSLIIVGEPWDPGPLRVYSFTNTGGYQQLSSISKYLVNKMIVIGNSVLIMGNNDCLPSVFDISDPKNIKLQYNGLEPDFKSGLFYKNLSILTSMYAYGNINIDYRVLDCSIPSKPKILPLYSADSWLTDFASDNIALGNYYYHNQTISILYKGAFNRFNTVATVSEGTINGVGGTFPPYYIIGDRLWKLMNN